MHAVVSPEGTVLIPDEMLKELEWTSDDKLWVDFSDKKLVISKMETITAEFLLKNYDEIMENVMDKRKAYLVTTEDSKPVMLVPFSNYMTEALG